jgi:hypothetical protein
LDGLKDGCEPARFGSQESDPLHATPNRRYARSPNNGQGPRELARDDGALYDLDAGRDDLLIGEEATDGFLNPTAGPAAGDKQVASLDVQGAAVAAQLGHNSGGITNGRQPYFTIVAEVGVNLGLNTALVRPGLQPGRQRAYIRDNVFHF